MSLHSIKVRIACGNAFLLLISMDLFKLADQLRAAYQSERHVPGKTAIVCREDGPPIYSSSQRLFHNFSIWAKEHQLPRDFALFSAMADAVAWLGSKKISDAHATHLILGDHPNECEQASCA